MLRIDMAEKINTKLTGKYTQAVGRRKRAIAQIRLFEKGSGKILVNDLDVADYFGTNTLEMAIKAPFVETGTENAYDVSVKVLGGGKSGQAGSIQLGISRALVTINPDFRTSLKKLGFLTRDARKRERKKYGKKSARRSPQWSKR